MKELSWCLKNQAEFSIIKIPLQFTFPPVEALMKQLTKLNSPHPYRIAYLGPRWENSVLFHKRYASGGSYEFNQRKISKNTNLLNDSMTHNQFYKNELYYRAFQGMNPTLNMSEEMLFQSRFQGGNLDCAVKINDNEYDLFLRVDSNTRGHIFWYYFSVKNNSKARKIKFNISNLTKNGTHYSKGLNPFVYSSNSKEWTQDGLTNVVFQQQRLRYQFLYERLKLGIFYELSFEVQFKVNQQIKFAYCIPYTYSDLLQDLKYISKQAEVNTLGYSLTGVKIPIVLIGKNDQSNQKPVLLITARIHPGQSNSSIILSKFMKYLVFSPEAKFLRDKILTVIVPMMNPDGVILGNSRCGASGKDLNREFKTRSNGLYPEIILLKKLVDKISQTHDLDNYLDFHGHSRKKNMFIFGPSYNITQPQYYKCRVFPKILSNITSLFRYYGSSYDIGYDKRSTARAVMLNQMMIPFVFTVQTSLGFYHNYQLKKDMIFTKQKWQEIGQFVVKALVQYFQGLDEYVQFIEQKKRAKKQIQEDIRTTQERVMINNTQLAASIKKPKKQIKLETKDVKIFKIFQQIKQLQEKKVKQLKKQKQKQQDNDSDSHDEKEDLQKQKLHEFNGMVSDYVEQQNRRVNNIFQGKDNKKIKSNSMQKNNNRQLKRKRKEERIKEQQFLMAEYSQSKTSTVKRRLEIRTQNKNRNFSQDSNIISNDRKQMKSFQFTKKTEKINFQIPQISINQIQKGSQKQHFEEQFDFLSVQKKNNKLNVRMFNFSKMVQNPRSLRYDVYKQSPKANLSIYKKNIFDSRRNTSHQTEMMHYIQESNKLGYLNNQSQYNDMIQRKKAKNEDDIRNIKGRLGFPPSFYRIKYHNNQRKKLQNKKQRQFYEFQQQNQKQSRHQRNMTNLNRNSKEWQPKPKQNSLKKQIQHDKKLLERFKK